jgi:hypothetical protein
MGALGSRLYYKLAAEAAAKESTVVGALNKYPGTPEEKVQGFLRDAPKNLRSVPGVMFKILAPQAIQDMLDWSAQQPPETQEKLIGLVNQAVGPEGELGKIIQQKDPSGAIFKQVQQSVADTTARVQAAMKAATQAAAATAKPVTPPPTSQPASTPPAATPAAPPAGQAPPATEKPAAPPAQKAPEKPATTPAPPQEKGFGEKIMEWFSSEDGQKLLSFIGPMIGKPDLAQMFGGAAASKKAPQRVAPPKPIDLGKGDAATPEAINKAQAAAVPPDSVAGLQPIQPGVNAYDSGGNQYHVSDDNRVWRRYTDPTTGKVGWQHLPNLSGSKTPSEAEGGWAGRQKQWEEYEIGQVYANKRYNQIYEAKGADAAEKWAQNEIVRAKQRAANRVNEERNLGKDAKAIGLTQFKPGDKPMYIGKTNDPNSPGVALQEADGKGGVKRYEGGVWTAGDQASAGRTKEQLALQEAQAVERDRRANRAQDPAYVAKQVRAYRMAGTEPPAWVLNALQNPEFAAQVEAHTAVDAMAADPKNQGKPFNRAQQYEIALQEQRKARQLQGPPPVFRKPGDPVKPGLAKKPAPPEVPDPNAERDAAKDSGDVPDYVSVADAATVPGGTAAANEGTPAAELPKPKAPQAQTPAQPPAAKTDSAATAAKPSEPKPVDNREAVINGALDPNRKADPNFRPKDGPSAPPAPGDKPATVAKKPVDPDAPKLASARLGALLLKAASMPEPALLRTKLVAAKTRAAELLGTKSAAEAIGTPSTAGSAPIGTPSTSSAPTKTPASKPVVKQPVRGSVKQTGPAPRMKGTQKAQDFSARQVTGSVAGRPMTRSRPQGLANPTSGVNAARVDTRNVNTREAAPMVIGGGRLGAMATRTKVDTRAASELSAQRSDDSGMRREVHSSAPVRNWGTPGLGSLASGRSYDVDRTPGARGRHMQHYKSGPINSAVVRT